MSWMETVTQCNLANLSSISAHNIMSTIYLYVNGFACFPFPGWYLNKFHKFIHNLSGRHRWRKLWYTIWINKHKHTSVMITILKRDVPIVGTRLIFSSCCCCCCCWSRFHLKRSTVRRYYTRSIDWWRKVFPTKSNVEKKTCWFIQFVYALCMCYVWTAKCSLSA